jgi:hypothetical protein
MLLPSASISFRVDIAPKLDGMLPVSWLPLRSNVFNDDRELLLNDRGEIVPLKLLKDRSM